MSSSPGEGSLLHTVQMALLYEDSKTFVDKPMKHSEAVVLANFRQMMSVSGRGDCLGEGGGHGWR